MADFGLSYTDVGLMVTVFFVVSGLGQASSGFLVDRVGARPVLFVSLALFASAALLASQATAYWMLLAAADSALNRAKAAGGGRAVHAGDVGRVAVRPAVRASAAASSPSEP